MGFVNFANDKKLNSNNNNYRYVEYHGGITDKLQRTKNKQVFNQSDNKYGKIIK